MGFQTIPKEQKEKANNNEILQNPLEIRSKTPKKRAAEKKKLTGSEEKEEWKKNKQKPEIPR